MNCTDRYPGCHDQCEKYKEAVATEKARRQKISDMRKVEAQYLGYKSEKRRFNKI